MENKLKVVGLTLLSTRSCLQRYHKSLHAVLTLLKWSKNAEEKYKGRSFWERIKFVGKNFGLKKELVVVGLILLLKKLLWVDGMLNALSRLIALAQISSSNVRRVRLSLNLTASVVLFLMLRKHVHELLDRFKRLLSFLYQ